MTWSRYRRKDHAGERFILYLCAAACIAAAIIDMKTEGTHVNAAIMISSIFLYMFRRSIDTNRDVLTKLLNRMSFYEDCTRYGAAISAVGSVDMNGLKTLNDAVGHEAGDAALREIGRILDDVSNKSILAYRTGGDEFVVLAKNYDARREQAFIRGVRERLGERVRQERKSYRVTVSIGCCRNVPPEEDGLSVQSEAEQYLREADRAMYLEKRAAAPRDAE
jgi:diguanylate cyclase (GGDEF)-like protein